MNITRVSERIGLPVKTIRYYDEIGLVSPRREPNGYRAYDDEDLRRLGFLARARGLGFSLEDCRALMGLYCDPQRASREVRDMAIAHLAELRRKIARMQEMEAALEEMIAACRGDENPDCAILDRLSRDLPAG